MRFKIEISVNEFELLMKKLQSIDSTFRWTKKTTSYSGFEVRADITNDKR